MILIDRIDTNASTSYWPRISIGLTIGGDCDVAEIGKLSKRMDNDGRALSALLLMKSGMPFEIEKVIFNDPATIVIWNDGTKTVVKATGEKFDREKGLMAAIAKKTLGNKGNFNNVIHKWVNQETTK